MTDLTKLVNELSELTVLEATELARRLEERWGQPVVDKITARGFNEGLACEALVQYLERRENGLRSDVEWPDAEQHSLPIEVAFKIGDEQYALEHTGIEPFTGLIEMEVKAAQLFDPIKTALNGVLDTTALFELYMPVNAFQGRKPAEVVSIPTIPKRPYPDYKGNGTAPTNVPGVPFQVVLMRTEPVIVPGNYFDLRHTVANGDQLRAERMRRAIEKKFPKLDGWKRAYGAKTILVLEQIDIQLTNPD
jgi:Ribosomal protein L7/L12 dimerisation domain